MGPEFFQTRMGQTFYEGTLPRMVKALERIATALESLEKKLPVVKDESKENGT